MKKSIFLMSMVASNVLFGCATATHAPKSSVSIESPTIATRLSSDGWLQEDEYYEKIVHYGTTRADNCRLPVAADCYFSPARLETGNIRTEQQIKYGKALVKIPFVKKVGGTSGMSLTGIIHDIGWENFVASLSNRDLLIFVHGFNTSFSDSAIRCAQLAHDINFKGESIFYAWPSSNKFAYKSDKIRARENFALLADFLQNIALNTDKEIHIIAHSMGAYLLINSLSEMDARIRENPELLSVRKNKNNGRIFSQIVLAAPDIAVADFRRKYHATNLASIAENITLYSAVNDNVLKGSRLVNFFVEGTSEVRLGGSEKFFFVVDGMDTVDTRQEISGQFFGHSFYAEYRSLVSDMHLLLNYKAKPDDRMLQQVIDSKGQKLWFIRD